MVISDRPDALARLSTAELGTGETALAAAAVGLVLLGSAAENTDAHLPLDASNREIAQVCRLVGRIVVLRRRSLEVEQKSDALARLAAIDPLTRVANRRTWDEQAFKRFRRALGAGQEVCLVIFDVDHFKAINDTRGHATGDAVLAEMGDDFGGLMRAGDLLARLGGDEFAALLVGRFDPPGVLAIVERIRGCRPATNRPTGLRAFAERRLRPDRAWGSDHAGRGGRAGGPICRGRCGFAAGETRRPGSDRAGPQSFPVKPAAGAAAFNTFAASSALARGRAGSESAKILRRRSGCSCRPPPCWRSLRRTDCRGSRGCRR